MQLRIVLSWWALVVSLFAGARLPAQDAATSAPAPSVLELPRIYAELIKLRREAQTALVAKRFDEAKKLTKQAIGLVPFDMVSNYDLARAQAGLGETDPAFESLRTVVELGFKDVSLLEADPLLANLRALPQFSELVKTMGQVQPSTTKRWRWQIKPTPVEDGVALVSERNTGWNSELQMFNTFFKFPAATDEPIMRGHGTVGKLLQKWYAEGTAAGNHGDLYDMHDAEHSKEARDLSFNLRHFPQLTRIEFDEEVRKRGFHSGLQNWFLFNAVVLGNSSTAITGTPLWRSQPRLAYTDPRSSAILYIQYRKNQLYIYPEHKDHDPGRNGRGGYGDVFPANTPYTIISQGSSFSDRPFLDAVACTLAAFHPQVKKTLTEHGLLMPTIQMILRRCYGKVKTASDYLSGVAHPTVFDGRLVDVESMVRLAHRIQPGQEPPLVQLRVVEEDRFIAGRDFFCTKGERLFDTPSAIARVMRSTQYWRRMVISAEDSADLNGRPLRFRWVLLRGDNSRVQIKRLNESGSRVELRVAYHPRQWIRPLARIDSNRVDIGVIVDNGVYFSAPAFLTFFGLDNEIRVYDEAKRIKSVQYLGRSNYVDPFVDRPKLWRDEYHYDEQGQLLGWTRIRGTDKQEFTPDGALVLNRDPMGRPIKAQTVAYSETTNSDGVTVLKQQSLDEVRFYEYNGDELVGRLDRKERLTEADES